MFLFSFIVPFCIFIVLDYSISASAFTAGFFPVEKHTQKITANSSTANAIQPRSTPVPFPANMS